MLSSPRNGADKLKLRSWTLECRELTISKLWLPNWSIPFSAHLLYHNRFPTCTAFFNCCVYQSAIDRCLELRFHVSIVSTWSEFAIVSCEISWAFLSSTPPIRRHSVGRHSEIEGDQRGSIRARPHMINPSHLFNNSNLSVHLPSSSSAPPCSSIAGYLSTEENEVVDEWINFLTGDVERDQVYYSSHFFLASVPAKGINASFEYQTNRCPSICYFDFLQQLQRHSNHH